MGENTSEKNNILELKSIADIKDKEFIIPSFQRGYRWEPVQVITLLEDIKKYIEKANDIKTFMCLQPVVFYKNQDNKLIVIDGQQRLTTIAIINKCLELDNIKIEYNKYENNKTLQEKLDGIEHNIKDKHISLENLFENQNELLYKNTIEIYKENRDEFNTIDDYYIILSYLTIQCWLQKHADIQSNIKELLKSDNGNCSIKFIWYDVTYEINGDETKAIDIFTRLNIGKIPLTDAELIKALFLKKDNFLNNNHKKKSIANMWHKIENTLNDDSFWYFLSKRELPRNERINLLLILNTSIKKIENIKDYNLFIEYYKKIQVNNIFNIWSEIENTYYTLKEWYNNYEMFHYIGFLINTTDNSLEYLYGSYHNNENNKQIQRNNIKQLVYNEIKDINIESIEYHKNANSIRKILLFLEIYSSIDANNNIKNLKEITYRFPFNLYVSEKWDIEHISSQTENTLQSNKDRKTWLENILLYYITNDELSNNIINNNDLSEYDKTFLIDLISIIKDNQSFTIEHKHKIFEKLDWDNIAKKWDWEKIFNFFISYEKQPELDEIQTNCIGNLVLLNSKINRAYKNAIFPVKRMVIINESKKGVFIPTNTKNAFLKFYNSKTADTLNYWYENDINNYRDYIQKHIDDFKEKTENEMKKMENKNVHNQQSF